MKSCYEKKPFSWFGVSLRKLKSEIRTTKVQILQIVASIRAKLLLFLCVFLSDLCASAVIAFSLLVPACPGWGHEMLR